MTGIKEFNELDGIGIKELVDRREIKAEEVVQHSISKIEQYNDELNAVVYTMFEEALKVAKEEKYASGPFSGVPTLIKELNDIKGHPSTQGSKLLKNQIASKNDVVVDRLQQSGLIFLGKTNSPEFGFLPTTEPELFGATKNPWDPSLSSGGSSGGAAAAVATGMVPLAQGSDGGGSIRIPSSYCGVFGLKPSRGRLPYSDYFNQLSTSHVLTKSVRDSALALDVLQGGGKYDTFPEITSSDSFLQALSEKPTKLRIGVAYDWNGQTVIDEETRQAVTYTASLLEALGHEVVIESPTFNFDVYTEQFINVWAGSGSVIIKHVAEMVGEKPSRDNLELLSYNLFKAGYEISALQYEEARILLQREIKKILSYFDQFDVLLTPVLNKSEIPLGTIYNQVDPIGDMLDNMVNYVSFPAIANVSGQPSMSVPLYWTESGMPIGSMFTGRLGDEKKLLQLAAELEAVNPWQHHYKRLQHSLLKKM
ncbi:amidase [Salirhabdus sp. Marseille-P4669]|uniref:amidase n=1 Tax=Salirhabdus sp. Marseille-P4669 TaxID=2042310 RepID=UPI000C7B1BC1|nr:amidase [Salirhabdus sp. Marseille-P4669]